MIKDSGKLIADACRGVRPARTPIFDIFVNDAVIEHFAGRPLLNGVSGEETAALAAANALDATRWIPAPNIDGSTWTDEVGNIRIASRWTAWIQKHALTGVNQWAEWIKHHINRLESEPRPSEEECAKIAVNQRAYNQKLNGLVLIHCAPSAAVNDALFGYCGLETFSYLWADYPDLIRRWLRALEGKAMRHVQLNAHSENCILAMVYSDIAYKERLMFSKNTLKEFGFFDNIAKLCGLCHDKGLKLIFHSDGYIMDVLPDLIAAGIDGLNPIEKAAGMDVYEIRRRYPELILVGGMDVTHLLPYGTPEQIRKETRRMISEAGDSGRLLIGSSTELENNVPLTNYLAFHDEVMRK